MLRLRKCNWISNKLNKTANYLKIYIRKYSATLNTNISMLWLHKSNWNSKFWCKKEQVLRNIQYAYSLLHSILIFIFYDYKKAIDIPSFNVKTKTLRRKLFKLSKISKNYCSYNFSLKQGIIRKFIFGNILLNSILTFQCYDCIKTIDILNFSVKIDTYRKKFLLELMLHGRPRFFWSRLCLEKRDEICQ